MVLFRTTARATTQGFEVPVHAWVFEAEPASLWRGVLLTSLRRSLGLERAAEENTRFRARAAGSLADNERGVTLRVALGGAELRLPPSGPDGHTRGVLRLAAPPATAPPWSLRVEARDGRAFETRVYRAAHAKCLVISDIDDTVKISAVHDTQELLRNTFLREYRAVPGLAVRFRRWAEAGARFEFVSSSPWQLYLPLIEFLDAAGIPQGALHLKPFRWKDESFTALFDAPTSHKTPILESLLRAHPTVPVVLVGDSGERDPEIYGALARAHPRRVARIFIRELEAAPIDDARSAAAFSGLDPDLVQIFRNAEELPDTLEAGAGAP